MTRVRKHLGRCLIRFLGPMTLMLSVAMTPAVAGAGDPHPGHAATTYIVAHGAASDQSTDHRAGKRLAKCCAESACSQVCGSLALAALPAIALPRRVSTVPSLAVARLAVQATGAIFRPP